MARDFLGSAVLLLTEGLAGAMLHLAVSAGKHAKGMRVPAVDSGEEDGEDPGARMDNGPGENDSETDIRQQTQALTEASERIRKVVSERLLASEQKCREEIQALRERECEQLRQLREEKRRIQQSYDRGRIRLEAEARRREREAYVRARKEKMKLRRREANQFLAEIDNLIQK